MSPAVPLEPTPQRRRHPGSGGIVAVRSRWAGGSPHPRYRVRLHDPGRSGRLLFDATFATQAEARRALAQVQALAILGEPVPDPRRRVGPLLDAYEAAIRAQRRPRAYLATEHHLRRWVRPYFAAMTLQQMNSAAELRGFLTWLRSQTSDFTHRPLKVSTMRHIVQVVSSFLEMCLQEGHIRRNAARGEFLRIEFSCTVSPTGVSLHVGERRGAFLPWWKTIHLEVYDWQSPLAHVTLKHKLAELPDSVDPARHVLTLEFGDDPRGSDLEILRAN